MKAWSQLLALWVVVDRRGGGANLKEVVTEVMPFVLLPTLPSSLHEVSSRAPPYTPTKNLSHHRVKRLWPENPETNSQDNSILIDCVKYFEVLGSTQDTCL